MSLRALLLIPLALAVPLTVLVATGGHAAPAPTRVAPLNPQCGACTATPPVLWIPWLPVQLPVPWQIA